MFLNLPSRRLMGIEEEIVSWGSRHIYLTAITRAREGDGDGGTRDSSPKDASEPSPRFRRARRRLCIEAVGLRRISSCNWRDFSVQPDTALRRPSNVEAAPACGLIS